MREHEKKIFSRLFLILLFLTLSGCDLQTRMLYYPSSYVPSQESLSANNLRFWPSDRSGYRGFVSTTPAESAKGTVVVLHGNAGTASDRAFYARALAPLGFRVILAEYPAYGGRKGGPGEAVFAEDAKETLRLAREQYGGPVYLLGESLGCGVAASAARDASAPVDGIILITPWDTLLSVAKEKFPWLPVSLFLRDKYDSVENLKAFQERVAVIGAERDEVIPIHHARALYESLPGSRKMWTIRGAGHNDWPDYVPPSTWNEIMDFVAKGKSR